MHTKIRILATICIAITCFISHPQSSSAQDIKIKKGDSKMKMSMDELKSWPMSSQMAAKEMRDKYGMPDEATPTMLVWNNNGVWKRTIISNMENTHNFPKMHKDYMEQSISYKVSPEKYTE